MHSVNDTLIISQHSEYLRKHFKLNSLTINVPHHIETNQLSIDWFLYDGEHWSLMG